MSEAKRFPRGCVASPHHLASSAGLSMLSAGGNAMDAALATNLTLGVVAPYLCGYGGDLFAIVWRDGLHAYNGSGRAPSGASAGAVRSACGSETMPGSGPLSVTVPGAVEAWFALLDRFGSKAFGELASPALALARDGFPLTSKGAGYIRASTSLYTEDWSETWRRTYEAAPEAGGLVQPALARTIEILAEDGPDAYYRGPIAGAIETAVTGHGGLLDRKDLAAHRGDWVDTISSTYRGVDIHEMPPNSQGVTALEALRIVEGCEIGEPSSAQRQHILIEATKLALADRDAHLTDPRHMTVDVSELASEQWASRRRTEIDPSRASHPEALRPAKGGTAYLCAADADGMIVSLIQSNYVGFGSGVTVPGFGINLQNRGAYFSLDDDHPNVIAPGKRTLHTLMPAMALRDGRPWLCFGTMGGDGQAQTQVQLLSRIVDDGTDIQEAIDAPRWLVSTADWSVAMEVRFPTEVVSGLEARGHRIEIGGAFETRMGHAHAILVEDDGYACASDPRAEGAALGL